MKEELLSRLGARTSERDAAEKRSDLLGNGRLLLAGVALILVILPLFTKDGLAWWGLIPVAIAFVVIGKLQDRAFDRRRRFDGAVRFYREALDRLEEKWRDLPDDGADLGRDLPPTHYAGDLDLFGRASLYQLLSRAVTERGRRTLADWLREAAPVEETRRRQAAVKELAEKLDFAETLATAAAGDEVGPIDHDKLLAWGEEESRFPAEGFLKLLAIAHPVVLFATLAYWVAGGSRAPLIVAILLQVITVFVTRRWTEPRASVLSGPERALSRFARLVEAIETAELTAPRLKELQGELRGSGRASERIRALTRLVDLLDARLNMFFALSIGPALMWDLNLTLRADRWRREIGPSLRKWFAAIGEIEALVSFGALLRERPDYALPELVEGSVFDARGLTHPLIDRTRVVENDLTLGGAGSVLMLSGSNMSGKSTLLRSVGVNVVLARAGAPVAAAQLRVSELELATSVRIVDSLAHGTSHFYAELARLKHIVDLAKETERPVLYLLDEMLHGTNSRERFIGAVSVIKWLSNSGAMGIVTTHDLALAKVAEELPHGKVTNQHFSDDIVDGEMHFDYRLREGPVASTNALRLMRHVGIDVELDVPSPD